MDGSPITQFPIEPDGYFRYEFKMRTPALYWYHPHIRTDKQIEKGLQAPLVMRDPDEAKLLGLDAFQDFAGYGSWYPDPQRGLDRTFVLDDILLETDYSNSEYGQLKDFALDDDFLADPDNTPAERAQLIFNGRDNENGILLVNGMGIIDAESHPEYLPTIYVQSGVPERWRFVNTATGRFMRVSIPGRVLHQVASDGGLLEHPIPQQPINLVPNPEEPGELISNPDPDLGIFLAVAERAKVIFVPDGEPGEVIYLEWHDYPRGRHIVVSPSELLPDGSVCEGAGPCFADHPEDGERAPKRILRIVVI